MAEPSKAARGRARRIVNGHFGMVEKARNGERLVETIAIDLEEYAAERTAQLDREIEESMQYLAERDAARAGADRLRAFAVAVRDEHECTDACFEESGGENGDDADHPAPELCPCGGDECWRCAAAQAITPPPWATGNRTTDGGQGHE